MKSTGMTLDELVSEAREAALEDALFEINGQEISEYLEDLQDHYAAADALAGHLGIAPQDAPAVSDLVAMVPGAMEKAREAGAAELQAELDLITWDLGIEPTYLGGNVVAAVQAALRQAREQGRQQGRQEAVAAMVAILQGIPHPGADLIAARLREAVPAPDREVIAENDGSYRVTLVAQEKA